MSSKCAGFFEQNPHPVAGFFLLGDIPLFFLSWQFHTHVKALASRPLDGNWYYPKSSSNPVIEPAEISQEPIIEAKGLAGHTAMAIGDMEDSVKINDIPDVGFSFALGRPWWGEFLGKRLNKNADEVTLQEVFQLIALHHDETNIYGTVYKIEFYVKKSQADKMIEWWENRYKHLKCL